MRSVHLLFLVALGASSFALAQQTGSSGFGAAGMQPQDRGLARTASSVSDLLPQACPVSMSAKQAGATELVKVQKGQSPAPKPGQRIRSPGSARCHESQNCDMVDHGREPACRRRLDLHRSSAVIRPQCAVPAAQRAITAGHGAGCAPHVNANGAAMTGCGNQLSRARRNATSGTAGRAELLRHRYHPFSDR